MKEYFISEIDIEKLYHLSDIKIKLDSNKRQHLLLTGKNGSGKTSLLLEIEKFLRAINDEKLSQVFDQYPTWINEAKKKYYLHLVIAKNMRQIRILNNV
mgnify:CR=1 FL=1